MVTEQELQKDVADYQGLQQQMQVILLQKQQVMLQEAENARAVEALQKAVEGQQVYRLAGTVLVPRSKPDLKKELEEEAESIKMRKDVLAKQEARLKAAMDKLREKFEQLEKDAKKGGGPLFGSADAGSVSG